MVQVGHNPGVSDLGMHLQVMQFKIRSLIPQLSVKTNKMLYQRYFESIKDMFSLSFLPCGRRCG